MKNLVEGYEGKNVAIVTKSGTPVKGVLRVRRGTANQMMITNLFFEIAIVNNKTYCNDLVLALEDVEIIAISI